MGGGVATLFLFLLLLCSSSFLAVLAFTEPFRRDPGNPQWHHGNFQDHRDDVRKMTHELLHSRAQVRALDC